MSRQMAQFKMGRRARIAMAVTAITALAGAAACGSQGATAGEAGSTAPGTEINVLVISSPSASAMEALAPAFTKKTGIKVNFIETSYDAAPTKILLDKQEGKSEYDVVQVDKPFFPELANAQALTPLGTMLKDTPSYDLSDFPQQIQQYQEYRGTTYGLALSTEPFLLWYRTDMYKAAGITSPPTTWQQYQQDSVKLAGNGNYGSAFDYGAQQSAKYWAAMLYENGGRLLNPTTNEPLLTSPVAEQTMQMYIQLAKQTPGLAIDGDAGAGAGQVTAFEQLNVGQMIDNSGWYSDLANPSMSKTVGKFAAAPMPQDKIGPYSESNLLYGWLIGIPSASKKKAAAWEFLMYILSKQNVNTFIKAGAPPPGRISTATNPTYLKELPYLGTMEKEASNAQALPAIPDIANVITDISQQISAMESGQVSVSIGLQRAQAAVTQTLKLDGQLH